MISSLPQIILTVLATYRISRMVAEEDGPYSVIDTLRSHTGVTRTEFGFHVKYDNELGKMISCPLCLSVWVGLVLVVGLKLLPGPTRFIVAVLGVSGGSVALSRLLD